jgi:uncharacterized protein (TIGR00251 family)
MLTITEKDGHLIIRVKVQPGAPRSEIVGEIEGVLKLRIAAPPVDGKANAECCKLLATLLKVSPGSVNVKTGAASRTKTITIQNVTARNARIHLDGALRVQSGRARRAVGGGKC